VDIALDANGDIDLTNGEARIVTGNDAIAQHLRIRFKTFLGEWFADRRIGVPWRQVVFVKKPNMRLVRALIREVVATTPGVAAVEDLQVRIGSDRVASISFTARAPNGDPIPFDFRENPLEVGP
jgi:hypothetical protein